MSSKQEVRGRWSYAPRRVMSWLAGVAIGAVALGVVVVGTVQATRPGASETSGAQPAVAAAVVVPIDHSVVQSIDAESDSTGASIAAYGP